eukprot:scaffold585_cov237-Pinguiococcus_pyrenoidosus.AAC.2
MPYRLIAPCPLHFSQEARRVPQTPIARRNARALFHQNQRLPYPGGKEEVHDFCVHPIGMLGCRRLHGADILSEHLAVPSCGRRSCSEWPNPGKREHFGQVALLPLDAQYQTSLAECYALCAGLQYQSRSVATGSLILLLGRSLSRP